jgi:multiple antibiotic resistance protein
VGEGILKLFGVDVASFAVAGSLVLFFLALEMILGVRIYKDAEAESASIVPIAFPLIAGAGTLTTLISIRSEYAIANIIIGILINSVLVFVVLKNTRRLEQILGKNGINVLRKVFGIILLAISVKLFTSNLPTLLS